MAAETCTDVLNKCGDAVHALIKVNQQQKDIIANQQKVIEDQKLEIDSSDKWYKDPLKVGALSFIIGAITAGYLIKK